jgi:hypothetical protein
MNVQRGNADYRSTSFAASYSNIFLSNRDMQNMMRYFRIAILAKLTAFCLLMSTDSVAQNYASCGYWYSQGYYNRGSFVHTPNLNGGYDMIFTPGFGWVHDRWAYVPTYCRDANHFSQTRPTGGWLSNSEIERLGRCDVKMRDYGEKDCTRREPSLPSGNQDFPWSIGPLFASDNLRAPFREYLNTIFYDDSGLQWQNWQVPLNGMTKVYKETAVFEEADGAACVFMVRSYFNQVYFNDFNTSFAAKDSRPYMFGNYCIKLKESIKEDRCSQ